MNKYENLRVSDLREIARSQRLKGWSRLRKDDLISFIIEDENFTSDRATEVAMRMGNRTVKELRDLARIHGVKIRSRANKSEIIYLLGENYGKRRRAVYEKKFGLWDSEIRADEETARWSREINEEERSRRPTEPARPRLTRSFMGGDSTRWFVDGGEYLDPEVFLYDIADGVREMVDGVSGPKKVHMNLSCVLEKEDPKTGDREEDTFGSRSGTHTITVQLGDAYDEMRERMLENLSKFQKYGSGWRLKSINGLEIGVTKFDPLSGSGYSKLPPFVAKKKTVINMKNEDDQCFKWAVTRALNPIGKNPDRITKELREQVEKYDWEGITFPTKVKDIKVWEKNNNVNIHVFGYDEDEKKTYTIRIGELRDPSETINLYLHDDNHYCVIKNLGRLISSQLSRSDHGKDICLRCLNAFGRLSEKEREEDPERKSLLEIHSDACSGHELQRSVYPNPGDTVKFKNYERLHDVPFAVYADFESFVKPLETEEKDSSQSYTMKYQSHVPSGFCYVIKCMDETVYPTKTVIRTTTYENEDMGKLFVDTLTEDLRPIYEILKNTKPIVMTESDDILHEEIKNCYACGNEFGTMLGIDKKIGEPIVVKKCRDHCHITGKYRGAACEKCNLRMRVPMFIPVLFHNLEGYDAHLFVRSLGLTEGDIKCIPKTDET